MPKPKGKCSMFSWLQYPNVHILKLGSRTWGERIFSQLSLLLLLLLMSSLSCDTQREKAVRTGGEGKVTAKRARESWNSRKMVCFAFWCYSMHFCLEGTLVVCSYASILSVRLSFHFIFKK